MKRMVLALLLSDITGLAGFTNYPSLKIGTNTYSNVRIVKVDKKEIALRTDGGFIARQLEDLPEPLRSEAAAPLANIIANERKPIDDMIAAQKLRDEEQAKKDAFEEQLKKEQLARVEKRLRFSEGPVELMSHAQTALENRQYSIVAQLLNWACFDKTDREVGPFF